MDQDEQAAGALPGTSPDELVDAAWEHRYSDPARSNQLFTAAAPGPERAILEAFYAWREQRLDDCLTLLRPHLEPNALSDRWAARAHSIHAAVLGEIGLVRAALESQLVELRAARATGDPIALASVVHDLGDTYEFIDPERAARQFTDALAIARAHLDDEGRVGTECSAIAALAISNLHAMDEHLRPRDLMALEEGEALAARGWPALAATVRAQRVIELLDAGDLAGARRLRSLLPEPEMMRDVTISALVVRALARLDVLDGHLEAARDRLQAAVETAPSRFALDLLADLGDLLEDLGDIAGALSAAKMRATYLQQYHAAEGRAAMRALEVWMRTQHAQRIAAAAEAAAHELRLRLVELNQDRERLRDRTRRDALTGLWNRDHVTATGLALTTGQGHQVAVVDVDRFKTINDRDGHAVGNEALRRVAGALQGLCGPHDTCARYGGDEFVVLRPGGSGRRLDEDLAPVTRITYPGAAGMSSLTTSVGVAAMTPGGFEDAFARADRLMYEAKRAGGEMVVADLDAAPAQPPDG